MKRHSKIAWDIASHFSHILASDTRTLASMIDTALEKRNKECADRVRLRAKLWFDTGNKFSAGVQTALEKLAEEIENGRKD